MGTEAGSAAASIPTYLLSNEDQVSPGRVRHSRAAGRGFKTASGADWVHEIKHDGYRLIVRRDGPTVRLYTRNAYD
jgi:ATP-dependent DNA ligase